MSLLWVTAASADDLSLLPNPSDKPHEEIREDGFYPIDADRHHHGFTPIEHIKDGDLVRPEYRKDGYFERAFGVRHDPTHPSDTSGDDGEGFPTRMFVVEHKRRFSPHQPEGSMFEVYRPRSPE